MCAEFIINRSHSHRGYHPSHKDKRTNTFYFSSFHCRILLFVSFLFMLVFTTCKPLPKLSSINLNHLYDQEDQIFNASYVVKHIDRQKSTIEFFVNSETLLYTRSARENEYTADMGFSWFLYESYENKTLVDSAFHLVKDTLTGTDPVMVSRKFTIETQLPGKYVLLVQFQDMKRNAVEQKIMDFDKSHPYTARFFQFENKQEKVYYPPFFISSEEQLWIHYNDSIDIDMSYNFYTLPSSVPAAPYVADNPAQDSGYNPLAEQDSGSFKIKKGSGRVKQSDKGLYYYHLRFRPDQGFCVHAWHEGFPSLVNAPDMIPPLRYITARKEYEQMLNFGNDFLSLERFWNASAGNPDRGRELMNKYNQRVERSNALFSSYKPGWQTDKGMIYIIYGKPDKVFRYNDREIWQYPETMNMPAVDFTFNRIDHPLSEDNFVLDRKPEYRNSWNLAVSVWRR
ncbi:MAG: GWxTD domain-containing protein [Bacteroidales bacterium]